jgi:hypothetical protein
MNGGIAGRIRTAAASSSFRGELTLLGMGLRLFPERLGNPGDEFIKPYLITPKTNLFILFSAENQEKIS